MIISNFVMMNSFRQLLLALGSNCDPERHIEAAQSLLRSRFHDVRFSRVMQTEPVGMQSPDFLNCMAIVYTESSYEEANRMVKEIETLCDRTTHDCMDGIIALDIDILEYDGVRHHVSDWNRHYIQTLLSDLT